MICPFCNQTLPDGSSFCGFCGKKLTEAVSEAVDVVETQAADTVQNVGNEVGNAVEAAVVTEAYTPAENTNEPAAVNNTPTSSENTVAAAVVTETSTPAENANAAENATPVNLGKAAPTADTQKTSKPENDVAKHIREGIQDAAGAVRSDTRDAVAAVKSGKFADLLKNKTFLICCGAVLAIIVLISIILGCVALGGERNKVKGAYYPAKDGGDLVYLYNGNVVKGDFSSDASILDSTPDGTIAVVEDDDTLYLMKNGNVIEITDDFDTTKAVISANGKTVVYVSEDTLYIYTGGKPKKLAELEDYRYCTPVVSPDGKVVVFSDMEDDDLKTYAWKGSKVIDLDADFSPISVSNGGKMIFGENRESDLCFIKNLKPGSDEKIDPLTQIVGISNDHNKIIYVSDGSTYCFNTSMDSEEGVRITRNTISPFADVYYKGIPIINDFNKFYGKENGNLYKYFRKGKEYDDDKLISDVGSVLLSDDNKSFVYIDDGDVMKGTLSNAKNAKKVGKDAVSVKANGTFNAVFYLDDDGILRYAGKDGKIASDVKRYLVTDGGVCVFYDYDGDLYYSVKGGEKKKTSLGDISSLVIRNDIIYVVSDGELYISTNGKTFKKTGVDVD